MKIYKIVFWVIVISTFFAGFGVITMVSHLEGAILIAISAISGLLLLQIKSDVSVKSSIIYALKNCLLTIFISPLVFFVGTYFADYKTFFYAKKNFINWYGNSIELYLASFIFPWLFATIIYNRFRRPLKSVVWIKCSVLFEMVTLWFLIAIKINHPHNAIDYLFWLSPISVIVVGILYFDVNNDSQPAITHPSTRSKNY